MVKSYSHMIEEIDVWLESQKKDMINDLSRLVEIVSISDIGSNIKPFGDGCRQVLDTMLSMGEREKFKTVNHEYYCGEIQFDVGTRSSIGLWAHLDVVPAGNGWINLPFKCTVNGDYITGRGVRDDKGPAIIGLYTLKCIRDLNIPIKNNIRLIVGCDEESGMKDIDYFLSKNINPEFSIIMDTDFPVCYAEKGILSIELMSKLPLPPIIKNIKGGEASNMVADSCSVQLIKSQNMIQAIEENRPFLQDNIDIHSDNEYIYISAKGKSAHAATPQGSINAIWCLANALLVLKILDEESSKIFSFIRNILSDYNGTSLGIDHKDPEMGDLTSIAGKISVRDSKLTLDINIRYPMSLDVEKTITAINSISLDNGFLMNAIENNKPRYTPKEESIVPMLNKVYNDITKKNHTPYVMGGGTYARKIPNSVAFGPDFPGVNEELSKFFERNHGGIHQPDETTKISNMLTAIKIYVFSILRMDQL